MFSNTAIKLTTKGKRHLGAALGTKTFKDEYVQEKVDAWRKEIIKLADFAKTQPHAAFSALYMANNTVSRIFYERLKALKVI